MGAIEMKPIGRAACVRVASFRKRDGHCEISPAAAAAGAKTWTTPPLWTVR